MSSRDETSLGKQGGRQKNNEVGGQQATSSSHSRTIRSDRLTTHTHTSFFSSCPAGRIYLPHAKALLLQTAPPARSRELRPLILLIGRSGMLAPLFSSFLNLNIDPQSPSATDSTTKSSQIIMYPYYSLARPRSLRTDC